MSKETNIDIEKLIEDRDRFRDDWKAMIIQIEDLTHDLNRYKKLAKEFYPYVQLESVQATFLGHTVNDCDPSCLDCEWYNWGMSFKERIENGEFNEIDS